MLYEPCSSLRAADISIRISKQEKLIRGGAPPRSIFIFRPATCYVAEELFLVRMAYIIILAKL